MSGAEVLAWVAAGFVIASVAARDFRTYRIIALASNLCFMAFGFVAEVHAILALHAILFVINVHRLTEIERRRQNGPQDLGPHAAR